MASKREIWNLNQNIKLKKKKLNKKFQWIETDFKTEIERCSSQRVFKHIKINLSSQASTLKYQYLGTAELWIKTMTGFLAIKKILCFSPKILNNRSFFIFWLSISINKSHTTALILLLDSTSLILICPIEPVKSIADSIWSLFYWATLILCLSWEDVRDPRSVVISSTGQYELENKYRTGNSLDLPC